MAKEYAIVYPRSDTMFEAVVGPSFSSILKEARKRKGIGLRVLAGLVNCSHSYLNLIEAGERKPAPKLLGRLQKELDLEPFFIVPKGKLDDFRQELHQAYVLKQSKASLALLIGLLDTALRNGGFDAIPTIPTESEREHGFVASFKLGSAETYEILIKQTIADFSGEVIAQPISRTP